MPELRSHNVRLIQDGVRFFEEPKVYLVGATKFHGNGLHQLLKDLDLEVKYGQMRGTDGEKVIEAGARACYLSYGVGRDTKEHLRNIRAADHGSVVRHATAVVMITGVSRGFTHELVRHAAGTAVSQSSSRYIPARRLGFVIPPEYRLRPLLRADFMSHAVRSLELYETHCAALEKVFEQEHPDWTPFMRTKTARGAARSVLPTNLNQLLQFSMNVQAFRHILRLRGTEHAEAEIREVAVKLAPIGKELWPTMMEDVYVVDGLVKLGAEI